MRWMKHMTNSWYDEKIATMVADHGLEMYGFWWRILEIIAKQMDKSPKTNCKYSAKVWSKFCGISPKKFKKFSKILEEKKLIILKNHENEIDIDVPNLMKFRDEFTSRNR